MANYKCKCGGTNFFTEVHGNNTGLYCAECGKWQKWLTKDEVRLFNNGYLGGGYALEKSVNDLLDARSPKYHMSDEEVRAKLREIEREPDKLFDRLMARINERAIKVSTVAAPHTYMRAVGTKELERILREELT